MSKEEAEERVTVLSFSMMVVMVVACMGGSCLYMDSGGEEEY